MHCVTAFLAALATFSYVKAGVIPLDAADGVYVHPVHPLTGKTEAVWVGELNTTTLNRPESPSLLKRKDGLNCDSSHTASSVDFQNAVGAMENGFGQGLSWSYEISFVSGGAVAYACDYGKGQTTTSFQVQGFLSYVDGQCGSTNAGWFAINEWKASYGRTNKGTGFCH